MYRTRTITKKAYHTSVPYFLAKIEAYHTVPTYHTVLPSLPKVLVITAEYLSKNCFFADFAIKTLFFCSFTPEFVEICASFEMKTFFFGLHPKFMEISDGDLCFIVHTFKFEALNFCAPPKFVYASPSLVMLSWRRACIKPISIKPIFIGEKRKCDNYGSINCRKLADCKKVFSQYFPQNGGIW